jgi:predicted nucleic acid-binding protein
MTKPPAWFEVVAVRHIQSQAELDAGESEAISLALELGIASILIDERNGFRVAAAMGLAPIGMLAVVEFCASQGWVDFEQYVDRLRKTTFRIPENVISETVRRLKGLR